MPVSGGAGARVVVVVAGLTLSACAQVWNLQTLTAGDGGADGSDQDGDLDAEADGAVGDDGASTEDANGADGASPDASDAMALSDGATDAGDAAAVLPDVAMCLATCTGCCDTNGDCHTSLSTTYCGAKGKMCGGCTNTCSIADAPCCTSAGACGCAVGGLVGCN